MATEYCTPSVRIYDGGWTSKGTATDWYGYAGFGTTTRGLEISFTPTKATTSQFHILVPQCVSASAGSNTWYYRVTDSKKTTKPQSVTGNIASGSVSIYSNVNTYANAQFQFNVSGITAGKTYYVYLYSAAIASGSIGYVGNSSTSGKIECRNYYTESSSSTTYYASLYDLTNSTYLTAENSYTTSSITRQSLTGYTYVGYKTGTSQSNAFNKSSYTGTGTTASLTSTNNHVVFFYTENQSSSSTTYYYRCYDLTNSTYITSSTSTTNSSITRPTQSGYTYQGYTYYDSFDRCLSYQQSNGYDGTGTTCSQHSANNPYVVFFYTKNTTTTTSYYRTYDVTFGEYLDSSSTTATTTTVTRPSVPTGYTYAGYKYHTSFEKCISQQNYDGTSTSFTVNTNYPYILFCYTANTYTVSYNLNGASGTAPSNTTRYYNRSYTLTSTTPSRSGYNFLGWSTNSSATSGIASGGTASASTSTSTITYYAIWQQIAYTATVSYNANGGSGAPGNQSATETDTSVSITLSSTKPTRDRYNFLGWATSASATSATHQPGQAYNFTGSTSGTTTTLYAVWENKFGADNVYYCVNGAWKLCEVYYCNGSSWLPVKTYYGSGGTWKNNT